MNDVSNIFFVLTKSNINFYFNKNINKSSIVSLRLYQKNSLTSNISEVKVANL